MRGAEYQRGWRAKVEEGGVELTVEARHSTRRRMPRGHEIARQMSRGRPVEMVEDPVYEWMAWGAGAQVMPIREMPGNRFCVGGYRQIYASVIEAAKGYAGMISARRSSEEATGPKM